MAANPSPPPLTVDRTAGPDAPRPDRVGAGSSMPTDGAPAAEGTGGWLGTDRIRTAALAIIALSVLWRAQMASRGFLAADDYVMITQRRSPT